MSAAWPRRDADHRDAVLHPVTFLIMNLCGITLNMMSLGGITLGVGMIVDNSIVVLENIFSYRADGYSR